MEVSFLDHFSVSKPITCITIADLLMFAWLTKWSMDIFFSIPLPHYVPMCVSVLSSSSLLPCSFSLLGVGSAVRYERNSGCERRRRAFGCTER